MSGSTSVVTTRVDEGERNKKGLMSNVFFQKMRALARHSNREGRQVEGIYLITS